MNVAIVIPAYNEAATISEVVEQVRGAGTVIVVDDASSDDTADLAVKAGAIVVSHESNRGYDKALQSGFEKADQLDVDAVITFDADGQHDPAVLNTFIENIKVPGVVIVLGIRSAPARVAEAVFNYWAQSRFGVRDILCGLKGYNIELYRQHGCFDRSGSIGTELALAGLGSGCKFSTVSVPIRERVGRARFGSFLRANFWILRAFIKAVWAHRKYLN